MKYIKKPCNRPECGEEMHVTQNRLDDGRGKYCSKACANLDKPRRAAAGELSKCGFPKGKTHPRKKSVSVACRNCDEMFETVQWRINQGKGKYCSPECRKEGSRGKGVELDGLWFGINGKNKYHWHKRSNGTSISLHRYVWEKKNGPKPDGHQIHHIDHDPSNNDIENLQLMTTSDHARHHLLDRIESGELDNMASLKKAVKAASEMRRKKREEVTP